jgi:hypothetical protein
MKTTKTMKVSEMIEALENIKATYGDTDLKFINEKGIEFKTTLNTLTINGITVVEVVTVKR